MDLQRTIQWVFRSSSQDRSMNIPTAQLASQRVAPLEFCGTRPLVICRAKLLHRADEDGKRRQGHVIQIDILVHTLVGE